MSFSVGAYSNGHNSTMNCQTKLVNSDQFFYLQIVSNGAAKFNRIICMVSCTKKNNVGSTKDFDFGIFELLALTNNFMRNLRELINRN